MKKSSNIFVAAAMLGAAVAPMNCYATGTHSYIPVTDGRPDFLLETIDLDDGIYRLSLYDYHLSGKKPTRFGLSRIIVDNDDSRAFNVLQYEGVNEGWMLTVVENKDTTAAPGIKESHRTVWTIKTGKSLINNTHKLAVYLQFDDGSYWNGWIDHSGCTGAAISDISGKECRAVSYTETEDMNVGYEKFTTMATMISDDERAEIDSLKAEIERLKAEIEALKAGGGSGSGSQEDLTTQIAELNSRLETAINRAETAEARVTELETELSTMRSNLETAQADLATAQGNLESTQRELITARNNLTNLQGQLATAQGNYDELNQRYIDVQIQLATMEQLKMIAEDDLATARGRIATLEEEIARLQTELATAQSEQGSANAELVNLRQEVVRLNQKLTETEEKLAVAEGNVAELGRKVVEDGLTIDSLNNDLTAKRALIEELNNSLSNARRELTEAQEQLEAMSKKLSDKLTEVNDSADADSNKNVEQAPDGDNGTVYIYTQTIGENGAGNANGSVVQNSVNKNSAQTLDSNRDKQVTPVRKDDEIQVPELGETGGLNIMEAIPWMMIGMVVGVGITSILYVFVLRKPKIGQLPDM